MAKDVQMTLRIEPELRTAFTDAAALEDRPAAQVLRELMRAYIAQMRERGHRPTNEVISAAERRRRETAVDFARASVGLEGFKLNKADEELSRQYVAGEITISDAIKAINTSDHEE